MRITTKGDYATRAVQDLAMHYEAGPVQIEEIARRQGLPARYLEQLLLVLKRVGLLESRRGAHGGYYLAKPPGEITLGQVIRAVDGPISPLFSAGSLKRRADPKEAEGTVLREIWAEVRDAVAKIVDSTTFEDICRRTREKQAAHRITYHI
jgi:Rrf2 family protein